MRGRARPQPPAAGTAAFWRDAARRERTASRFAALGVLVAGTVALTQPQSWWQAPWIFLVAFYAARFGRARMRRQGARMQAWQVETGEVVNGMLASGLYSLREIHDAVQHGPVPPPLERTAAERAWGRLWASGQPGRRS